MQILKLEKKISKESGMSRPGMLFFLSILGGALYVAYNIFPFYYNYYELLGLMQSQARVASEYTDEKIREVLNQKIKDLRIPIKNDYDLQLYRSGNNINIYLAYTEEFWIRIDNKDYKVWEFPFVAKVEQQY